ncbi:MAG: tRNA 2-thiouridine(34) synthase MnmA [Desulfuromonadaceae bacterium]|nr:tRNA 2-thiouridine(34) synthase MnmA [Desulfuromonadaceae bacterium]MDD5107529.1 tRNA 2-thiouridine(34) synthase MnmA [Desulfuromonadaceae bacterium]
MSIIAVAMSGGVDSSVTAALLKQQGHDVIGITMCLFDSPSSGTGSAVHDAANVARHLDIPHVVADFSPDFRKLIIGDFIDEYRIGQTPNPCVRCNRYIKFGLLLEKAHELGAEFLATGHYARNTVDSDGTCHLRIAGNTRKDQSYFLYTLTQQQLSHVIFPLGDITSKDEVRRLARDFALPVAEKSDSQEVCFVPHDDYVAFLEESGQLDAAAGDIIHLNGQTIGRHRGTHRYTIGQRKGLGIAWSEPLYVTEIDAERRVIIVGEEPHVRADGLHAEGVSWIIAPDCSEFSATCKIRYRHQPVECRLRLTADNSCTLLFTEPQKAVTPGQAVVFYREDEVLGGGRITRSCR